MAEAGTFVINPAIYPRGKLTYDEKSDFIPITGLVRIHQRDDSEGRPDLNLLERVLSGLRKI